MDLSKLVAELREYRAQVVEAITALEDLARRRHPAGEIAKRTGTKTTKRHRTKSKPMAKSSARQHKSS
jgi:hypothetical protein